MKNFCIPYTSGWIEVKTYEWVTRVNVRSDIQAWMRTNLNSGWVLQDDGVRYALVFDTDDDYTAFMLRWG